MLMNPNFMSNNQFNLSMLPNQMNQMNFMNQIGQMNQMSQMNMFNSAPLFPMMNPTFNIYTNQNIDETLTEIQKYISYIQECLLNSFKGNNFDKNINEIIDEIIRNILKYFDLLIQENSDTSPQVNNDNRNIFNISNTDKAYVVLDNINVSIYIFLKYLNDLLSNKYYYQYISYDLIKKRKNDISFYLSKLNDYILVLQNSLLKYLRITKKRENLSDLITNVKYFKETIKPICIIPNNNMNPNNNPMNNLNGMNMMNPSMMMNLNMMNNQNMMMNNQNMMNLSMMNNPNMQTALPMFQNQIYPQFPMNMNMSNPINNNKNFDDNDEINKNINIIKFSMDKFLYDIQSLVPLNQYEYIFGVNYFEPIEVKYENEKIIDKINSKVYKYLEIDEKQNRSSLEIEGKLLYSIGGIARISLDITNRLYSELFEGYKKYLDDPKKLYHSLIDKKNFSSWAKNKIDIKNIIKNFAEKNQYKIFKYIIGRDDIDFLIEIYNDFLSLFLKCSLSIPLVEIEFLNDKNMIDKQIDTNTMIDMIIKNKRFKVNFCFLPQLSSNNGLIPGAKFHVFTYKEYETYKHENIDYEIVKQNTQLNY